MAPGELIKMLTSVPLDHTDDGYPVSSRVCNSRTKMQDRRDSAKNQRDGVASITEVYPTQKLQVAPLSVTGYYGHHKYPPRLDSRQTDSPRRIGWGAEANRNFQPLKPNVDKAHLREFHTAKNAKFINITHLDPSPFDHPRDDLAHPDMFNVYKTRLPDKFQINTSHNFQ